MFPTLALVYPVSRTNHKTEASVIPVQKFISPLSFEKLSSSCSVRKGFNCCLIISCRGMLSQFSHSLEIHPKLFFTLLQQTTKQMPGHLRKYTIIGFPIEKW